MATKIRVLVVDDSALFRSLLSEIINREPDMHCVGVASDPLIAREMIRQLTPDVMTLDIEMPRMAGIDFLRKLIRLRPMPVLMVSTLTDRGADAPKRLAFLGLGRLSIEKIIFIDASTGGTEATRELLMGLPPDGLHLTIERSGVNYLARVRDGDAVNRHKPSVEALFESAARVVGPNALGVMLTGMGQMAPRR